jgi:hypothetical protein
MRDEKHPRLLRERKTVEAMIRIACEGRHEPSGELCDACSDLVDYALRRLEKCPYQAAKPTCAKCPIHCYRPSMREEIRSVMSYAGPRMIVRHPILALGHVVDGLRKTPEDVLGPDGRAREDAPG